MNSVFDFSATRYYYDTQAAALATAYEQADMSSVHADLTDFFAPGSRLLECGSGSGREAAFLLRQGMDVLASDGSAEMVRQALLRHPELAGRLARVSLPEGLGNYARASFDGVISIATLMHFTAAQVTAFMENVAVLLKPGGKFYFSICLARAGVDEAGFDHAGRFFLLRPQNWWNERLSDTGFSPAGVRISNDGLGRREIRWLSVRALKKIKTSLPSATTNGRHKGFP
ncbi:MAG: class I SAM-dependent methyltransferase [Deltaproteobacteria bacterium]|nr:class I SAM-dependent methyltransferase [Deltaproteobacteria bacterium]